jgi:hypothetical protein
MKQQKKQGLKARSKSSYEKVSPALPGFSTAGQPLKPGRVDILKGSLIFPVGDVHSAFQ